MESYLDSIASYNYLYNNKNPIIKVRFVIIILIILLFMFIYFNNSYYYKYYANEGIVTSEDTLKIYVKKDDLNKVIDNKKMKIENKTFAYKIDSISEPLFNEVLYYEVILLINLDSRINNVNNIVKLKILYKKQTILRYIIYKIGGV